MKKFIKKLAAILIVNFLISGLLIQVSYADDSATTDPVQSAKKGKESTEVMTDLTECIDENGDDKGYIIISIEESLDVESKPGSDFQLRTCFRNVYQEVSNEGQTSHEVKIATDCSAAAQSKADSDGKKYKFSCQEIQYILSRGGTTLIYGYIGMIYRWAASLVGVVAVLVIILSGIQLSAAGGDQEAVNKAKTRIIQSLAGIVVLFLSGLILYTINPNFFVK